LSVFKEVSLLNEMLIWPVGSKGILYEMNQIFPNKKFSQDTIITDLDILKSSGPATCFITVYHHSQEELLKKIAGSYFHSVRVV
jgi:hypothetical protein